MHDSQTSAPPPDLRIVPTACLHAHEEHDSQRALPLVERLRTEQHVINPPIVAPMGDGHYVILDGANRCYAFAKLNYPHSLVQVVDYHNGSVELGTWQHVISSWDADKFIHELRQLPDIRVSPDHDAGAIARIRFRDGQRLSLFAPAETTHERNAALRHVVGVYQRNAVLNRTATAEPERIWPLYEKAIAIVFFPSYEPDDIIAAAREHAYLPPGISRHIVFGRAIRINYPIDALRDLQTPIEQKNAELQNWMQQKVANRQVRYYAESTYQFDE
jgi:hypothetical protein